MSNNHQLSGNYELLSTKLVPPPARSSVVPRQRLLARLDEGLDHKINLISAPAGFGKTTLVSEWIDKRRKQDELPAIAWVTLDECDNDPVRFWRYVLTACQTCGERVSQSALSLLNNSPQPAFEALLTQFINEAAQLPNKAILVLEDYHTITAKPVHETLAFFLDNLPVTLHLILMTRGDPPLPLARLRAHNELKELRTADLRFTLEETQAFLQLAVPASLPSEIVTRLAERTEGWAAGLHLVALALQRLKEPSDIEQYLASFTGSHRPILEYLVADVFNAQPETVQAFLLQTSFLSRLTGPLCDAVSDREDSALLLEQLEHANLFLMPIDEAGRWYRYHGLFAEAMQHYAQQRLGIHRLHELARKASSWYAEHAMLADAIEASIYAQDYPHTADLVERVIAPRLVQNEFHTLRRWMEQIPQEVLYEHPEICLSFASAILFTSNPHKTETKARLQSPLEIAERHWQEVENDHKLGEIFAFRSMVEWQQKDFGASYSFAKQALALLPDADHQWRGISLIMIGVDELMGGKLNAARQTLSQALAHSEASGNMYAILDSMLFIGEVCYQQGELHQAQQVFQQALSMTEDAPIDQDQASIRAARAQLGLSELALEWNDLQAAEQAVNQAIAARQQFPEEDLLADSAVVLAQVEFARGETSQAQRSLEARLTQVNRALLLRLPRLYQARFALASGDLAAVQHWASTKALPGQDLPALQLEQEALVVARMHIEQGEAEAALQQLENWLADAREHGRTRSEIQIRLLQAMAQAALGESEHARQILIQALVLAQQEGHQRIFLDKGEKLAELLQNTVPDIQDASLAAYGRAILYTLAQEQTLRAAAISADEDLPKEPLVEPLIEPLTEQEQRVMRLIAGGRSNPEIAEELFISVNTVKTHVKNIYAKLNVNNRKDARQAARHLKLY
jgi:LuxR family maltose regulon positive regulatory protein